MDQFRWRRFLRPNFRSDTNANGNSQADANRDSNAEANRDSDFDGYSHSYGYIYAEANSDPFAFTYGGSHCYSYT